MVNVKVKVNVKVDVKVSVNVNVKKLSPELSFRGGGDVHMMSNAYMMNKNHRSDIFWP
mgnify:CR=1 FL=1